MRTHILPPTTLILALLGAGVVQAQDIPGPIGQPGLMPQSSVPGPSSGYSTPFATPIETLRPYGEPLPPPSPPIVPSPGLPDYITYHQPGCCGPLCGGLITWEIYLDTGPSLPIAGGLLHSTLDTGWLVEGGARTYFFNPQATAAWTIDFSLSNTYNNSNRPNITFPLNGDLVTVRDLNRTQVNFGAGRSVYLMGSAHSDGCNWRLGLEAGGSYGTARLNLNDFALVQGAAPIPNGFRRRNDVIGGTYITLESDLEIPLGAAKLVTGLRVDWDYTWIDLIHHTTNDISDLNFLLTVGLRF